MLTNNDVKEFAINLANTESEGEVIKVLKEYGYFNDELCWKPFGNNENNFSVIGAQQSSADAALVEKLINSVDAVLIRKCMEEAIDPTGVEAPPSIRDALEKFYQVSEGNLIHLNKNERNMLAQNIRLYTTGSKSKPNYCVVDLGEGQSPSRLPETILSLSKSNKLRIPFVQGKFNMGGTGVLQFCGENNFQLIISKRCPRIPDRFNEFDKKIDHTKDYWGVSIVRRSPPKKGAKSSSYEYLAPGGNILKFKADEFNVLPESKFKWGTFIKLYEYKIPGCTSVSTFDLYYRLSLLMPNVALPIRIIETRDYKGNTLETTINGLRVRLEEDRNKNLEENFPYRSEITVNNQKIKYSLYAFKEGNDDNYRKQEGVIFVINGQAHGFLPKSLFGRKKVGLGYIKDSLLAVLDCSDLDLRSREDLFMNSRDKLRDGDLKKTIEDCLEDTFKNNVLLKELQKERRKKAIEDKIGDSKPLSEVLNKIMKQSPSLKDFLSYGSKVINPFDIGDEDGEDKGDNGGENQHPNSDFKGEFFPTYFHLKGKVSRLLKSVPKNRKARVIFETDAENGYFGRKDKPGQIKLTVNGVNVPTYSMNLVSGRASLNITLPTKCRVGDQLEYKIEVTDGSRKEPFIEKFIIYVMKATPSKGMKKNKPNLAPPELIEVKKQEWSKHQMNEEAVLRAKEDDGVYDFFVNMDNVYLQSELLKHKDNEKMNVIKSQYKYGMSLIALAILQHYTHKETKQNEDENEEIDVTEKIYEITKIIAPLFLPMVTTMNELQIEEKMEL
ncbi:hypothetical protein LGQ02_09805 [Bacillus shivajii]|uniref:hypothetical protein n=1 Tax=Bacillus shivajii TaxID=1983719 RepID=UPI001CFBA2AE|nr:hypothetical protein [Bacillus shivajii]UCZ54989.1 hypothetical protein LGQ02_09805 [Bacillus shivajii]